MAHLPEPLAVAFKLLIIVSLLGCWSRLRFADSFGILSKQQAQSDYFHKCLSSLRTFLYIARLSHGRCRSYSRTQDGSDPRAVGPGCSLFRVLRKEEFAIVSAWYVIRFIQRKLLFDPRSRKRPSCPICKQIGQFLMYPNKLFVRLPVQILQLLAWATELAASLSIFIRCSTVTSRAEVVLLFYAPCSAYVENNDFVLGEVGRHWF